MPGGSAKTLPEVIRKALERFAADLRVSVPARVERFDPTTGLADVKPLLRDFFDDGEEVRSISVGVICNVPVQFPGAGGFRMTMPVKPGDLCLLVFSDRSLDVWLALGGEVDPVDPRRHALSDAVALLGVVDTKHAWHNVATDALTIGHDGSGPRAAFKAGAIELDGGSSPVARKGDAAVAGSTMSAWIQAVTACLAGAGPASRSAAVVAPTDFGVVNEGAERVKA